MDLSRVLLPALAVLVGPAAPVSARVQAPVPGVEQEAPRDDAEFEPPPVGASGVEAAVRAARSAQARFETRRVRWFPRASGARGSGPCDERIGRFCSWYGEGDWVPVPEAPEITELRADLLGTLDSLQRTAPGEDWILGQRVWYRAEAGDWEAALRVADGCAPPHAAWWCEALAGLALDGLGRIEDAERAFDRALAAMDPERAWRWRVPGRALDGAGRRLMDQARGVPPDSAQQLIDRLWALADPLHLVPGNDRRSAHFARWTVATLREGSRTPYGLRWASDLDELVIRNGWELGWERETDPRLTGPDQVIGRNHPEGRDYLPPGAALAAPQRSTSQDHVAESARPASVHAPAYAPVILPMTSQVAVFPRGRSFAVVATHDLPADTTRRAREGRPRPWMDPPGDVPPDVEGDVGGLHLLDAGSGEPVASNESRGVSGVSWVEASAGPYLLSVEAWSPHRRLAGRHREGIDVPVGLEDVLVLSDLLLVRPPDAAVGEAATDPALPIDLPSAAPRTLLRPAVAVGEPLGVFFEVSGLGFRAETLTFELAVERTDRSLLQRLGGLIGRGRPDRPLALSWREPAPDRPGLLSREVQLRLPDVEPGRYEIRLVVRGEGRDPVQSVRVLEIVSESGPAGTRHVDPSGAPF